MCVCVCVCVCTYHINRDGRGVQFIRDSVTKSPLVGVGGGGNPQVVLLGAFTRGGAFCEEVVHFLVRLWVWVCISVVCKREGE